MHLVMSPSEGSVIAYYLSEFSVPAGQETTVDNAMSSMNKGRILQKAHNNLAVEDVVSSGKRPTSQKSGFRFGSVVLNFCVSFASQWWTPACFQVHSAVSLWLISSICSGRVIYTQFNMSASVRVFPACGSHKAQFRQPDPVPRLPQQSVPPQHLHPVAAEGGARLRHQARF